MVTAILKAATGVTLSGGGAGSSSVVGASPQWADDDDATYAYGSNSSTSGGLTRLTATMEPLPDAFTSVTSVTLHVRAKTVSTGTASGDFASFAVSFPDTVDVGLVTFVEPTDAGDGVIYLPGGDAIYDHATSSMLTAFSDPVDPNDLLALLKAGAAVEAARGGFHSGTWALDLYVYELWLVVEGAAGSAPALYVPAVLARPSLRMLQRGGSGGIAGIPRMIGDPTVRGSVRRGPGSVY